MSYSNTRPPAEDTLHVLTSPVLPRYAVQLPRVVRESLAPSFFLAFAPEEQTLLLIPGRCSGELLPGRWREHWIRFPELRWLGKYLHLPFRHADLLDVLPGDQVAFVRCGPAWLIGHAEAAVEQAEYWERQATESLCTLGIRMPALAG